MTPQLLAAMEGFGLGAGLIIAIGVQNAFVLRQGLLRRHVLPVVTFCAISDAALILAGVLGFGTIVRSSITVLQAVTVAGAAFLVWYGFAAAKRALDPATLKPADSGDQPLSRVLAAIAAVTLLNPHVYLDTVVLLGGVSARYGAADRLWFAAGAVAASFTWFFALGYGARILTPLFRKPVSWRVLDGVVALVMFAIAARLLMQMGSLSAA
ncbi:LysE/ArgO family amino acid transporter [Inquilinus sp. CAU 1745]|uniref:LysE/ArgO family amino acid transporter n=1 Tax=Inquilinus sp. CAU 1745 TaxID=3140369 RepID=UPI00325A45A1